MGEIILSIFVGGWMAVIGIVMNRWLTREERNLRKASPNEGGDTA